MAVNRVVRAASRVARTPDSRTRSQAKAANKAAANRVVAEANRAAKRESRFGEHRKPRESGAFQSRARQKLRLVARVLKFIHSCEVAYGSQNEEAERSVP